VGTERGGLGSASKRRDALAKFGNSTGDGKESDLTLILVVLSICQETHGDVQSGDRQDS